MALSRRLQTLAAGMLAATILLLGAPVRAQDNVPPAFGPPLQYTSKPGHEFDALLADKAFDIDWLRLELDKRGAAAVIPPKSNRARRIPCDFEMYKWRHLVENFFCKLKAFRRIATRYEKTDESFSAMIHLVGSAIAIR